MAPSLCLLGGNIPVESAFFPDMGKDIFELMAERVDAGETSSIEDIISQYLGRGRHSGQAVRGVLNARNPLEAARFRWAKGHDSGTPEETPLETVIAVCGMHILEREKRRLAKAFGVAPGDISISTTYELGRRSEAMARARWPTTEVQLPEAWSDIVTSISWSCFLDTQQIHNIDVRDDPPLAD